MFALLDMQEMIALDVQLDIICQGVFVEAVTVSIFSASSVLPQLLVMSV